MSDDATTQYIREAVAKNYADRLVNDDELRMQVAESYFDEAASTDYAYRLLSDHQLRLEVAEANFKDLTYEELVVCACFAFDEETLTSLGIPATGHSGARVVQRIDGCTVILMSDGWPTGAEFWTVSYGDQRLGKVIFDGSHSTVWLQLADMESPKLLHQIGGGGVSATSSLEDLRKSVLGNAVGLLKHAIAI